MDNTTLVKRRWFWAWDDEAEEAWLRQMAQDGWRLTGVAPFGRYTFTAAAPQDIVYRLDYQPAYNKDLPDYLQLFQDAGWEHVGEMSGWHYFSQPAQAGEAPEIFSDVDSKALKYRRLLAFIVVFLPIGLVFFNSATRMAGQGGLYAVIAPGVELFWIVMIGLYIYIIVRLLVRINQLKNL